MCARATVPSTVKGQSSQNQPLKPGIPKTCETVSKTNKCHRNMPYEIVPR